MHRMRVATRWLWVSLQIVEPIDDRTAIRRFRRGLRYIAQALGNLRELDVLMQHVLAYRTGGIRARSHSSAATASRNRGVGEPLRAAVLAKLGTRRYQMFQRSFAWIAAKHVRSLIDLFASARDPKIDGTAPRPEADVREDIVEP